jgi:WD40 repeat protein
MRRLVICLCFAFFLISLQFVHAQDHSSSVAHATSIAWSPDGTRIAASFSDSTIKVWNFNNNIELGAPFLTFHPDLVDKIEWTPDSQSLVAQGTSEPEDRLIRTQITKWDANTGERVQTLFDYQLDMTLVSNPYLSYLFYPVVRFNHAHTDMVYSSDSLTVTLSNTLSTFSVDACGHFAIVRDIVWSPDDSRLAVVCGGMDGNQIQTFDVKSTQPINIIQSRDYKYELQWSADSSLLAVLGRVPSSVAPFISISIYTVSPDMDYQLVGPDKAWFPSDTLFAALAWQPLSYFVAIATARDVQLYDAASGEFDWSSSAIISLQGATALAWSPDGQSLVGGLEDGTVQVWNIANLIPTISHQAQGGA